MVARPSLKGRVGLAIAFLVGFYVLALGLAWGLIYIPYAEWVYAHEVTWRILAFCVFGAFAIVRGIIPRRDRFNPPGPELTEAQQPRLFTAIKDVAAATNQAMPEHVYLVPDVNAFVSQRGGVMGVGSDRVMGIGLPLLDSLTVSQFRAVIAHEFGHYYGGDTRLGPWIHQTRAAIMRTLNSVGRHSGGLLQKPFIWYGTAFSRVSLAISRRQEYVADELAARTCGPTNLAEALKALEKCSVAFDAFMRQDFVEAVEAGFRPPFIDGFSRFRAAPGVRSRLEDVLAKAMQSSEAGPFNSHPSLSQRLAAISELSSTNARTAFPDDEARASSLIDDLPRVEAALIASMLKKGTPTPTQIAWEDVPNRVFAVSWAKLVLPSLSRLDGLTPSHLPAIATRLRTDADALVARLALPHDPGHPEFARYHAEGILGAAIGLVLVEHLRHSPRTFRLTAALGDPVVFHISSGDRAVAIEPFATLGAIRGGSLDGETWLDVCRVAGIADDDLGACARRAVERLRER